MAERAAGVAQTMTAVLRNRNFLLLWCAYGVSAMGDHLSEIALLKSQDALNTSVDITALTARMTFMFFAPFFLLAPVAGALADAFSRRAIMVTADLVRCAIMLAFGWLIAMTRPWGSWGAFAPLAMIGAFAALFSPARSALLPTVIRPDQLVRANGLLSGLGIISTMVASLLGGMLAQRYHETVAFRVDAVTFACSAVFLLLMRLPPTATQSAPRHDRRRSHAGGRTPVKTGLIRLYDGWKYVRAHRHVLELMGVAIVIWFGGSMVYSVIPAVVRDAYGGNYQDISYYRALLGLGFIIGAAGVAGLGSALREEIGITWGLIVASLGIATFLASVLVRVTPSASAILGGCGVVIAGIGAVTVMASFNALLQRTVANRFRGRVFGLKDVVSTGALLAATGLLGLPRWERLDRWVGIIVGLVAVLTLAAGVCTLIVRTRRSSFGFWLTLASHLNEFIARCWWRLERVGPSRVPRTGPAIITANHNCTADPVFISAAVPYRLISFIIAAEYATWPGVRSLVRILDCVPVRRGERDLGATKKAIRHLQNGKVMGIFIEGGIGPPGEPRTPKDGVATLALKTGAPVIPAYISGIKYREGTLRGLMARHRARIRMGPPVDLSEFMDAPKGRDTIRAASRKIYAAIWALAPGEGAVASGGDERCG